MSSARWLWNTWCHQRAGTNSGSTIRIRLSGSRLWLRVECDFVGNEAGFHYSVDRKRYLDVGEPHEMSPGTLVSQGVACSLFCVGARDGRGGGHAEFGSFEVSAQRARHRGE